MKVEQLIERLKKVEQNKEIRLANINIADSDGNMPTFELLDIDEAKGLCLLVFLDDDFINPDWSLT